VWCKHLLLEGVKFCSNARTESGSLYDLLLPRISCRGQKQLPVPARPTRGRAALRLRPRCRKVDSRPNEGDVSRDGVWCMYGVHLVEKARGIAYSSRRSGMRLGRARVRFDIRRVRELLHSRGRSELHESKAGASLRGLRTDETETAMLEDIALTGEPWSHRLASVQGRSIDEFFQARYAVCLCWAASCAVPA